MVLATPALASTVLDLRGAARGVRNCRSARGAVKGQGQLWDDPAACTKLRVVTQPPPVDPRVGHSAAGHLDENTRTALYSSQVIDLTTTGRRTGQPRRIEIFLHEEDGQLFVSGMPPADRTRDWIHNATADAHVVAT